MKFKKIKKWCVNETWLNKNRKHGLVAYIHKTPKFYHFSVVCYKIRCKNEKCIKCDLRVRYSSLEKQKTFTTFDECVLAVESWYKIYIK